jgi:hypothetical protein
MVIENFERTDSKIINCFPIEKDENIPNEMTTLWDNEKVAQLCMEKCVCLKLEASNESCKQFAEICMLTG